MRDNCLGCQRCEDGPVVTLHDGRVVCNYCPDYKYECLARHVLSMPTVQERREFLAAWGQKHGNEAGTALADLVRSIWEARRRA
jgi:hypothetical protein